MGPIIDDDKSWGSGFESAPVLGPVKRAPSGYVYESAIGEWISSAAKLGADKHCGLLVCHGWSGIVCLLVVASYLLVSE